MSASEVDVDHVRHLIDAITPLDDYPHATTIIDEVVIYDMDALSGVIATHDGRRAVLAEFADVFSDGPGVLAIRGAVDRGPLDRATGAFESVVQAEKEAGGAAGDHFAAPGANDRVWNALEKLALASPDVFVEYYACEAIDLASTAWLGPAYQVTSQLNVVNPGGTAQSPHCDYHVGFMTDQQAASYPAHAHRVSAALTLQGAIAHVDMSVESGPTKLLPHSQKYPQGYLAWRNEEVIALFEERNVQLPLRAGDAVFFNPALFHAAGENRTAGVKRMANLLQISSAMGRSTESVDRRRVVRSIYPSLLERRASLGESACSRVIAAAAEGYPFPTNLDRDQPLDGLAPPSPAHVVEQALLEEWDVDRLDAALAEAEERRRTN